MALKRISDLGAAATLTGTELVPVDQGSSTLRATTQAIANLAASASVSKLSFESTAHGAISAETVAAIDGNGVHNPNLADAADVQQIVGITANAAADGAAITVLTIGQLTETGWSWAPGPLYCGANGALTQTAPASGAVVQVATALTPTTIQVGIRPAYLRSN